VAVFLTTAQLTCRLASPAVLLLPHALLTRSHEARAGCPDLSFVCPDWPTHARPVCTPTHLLFLGPR